MLRAPGCCSRRTIVICGRRSSDPVSGEVFGILVEETFDFAAEGEGCGGWDCGGEFSAGGFVADGVAHDSSLSPIFSSNGTVVAVEVEVRSVTQGREMGAR